MHGKIIITPGNKKFSNKNMNENCQNSGRKWMIRKSTEMKTHIRSSETEETLSNATHDMEDRLEKWAKEFKVTRRKTTDPDNSGDTLCTY